VCERVNCSSQAGVKRLLTWYILALNEAQSKHQNVQQQCQHADSTTVDRQTMKTQTYMHGARR